MGDLFANDDAIEQVRAPIHRLFLAAFPDPGTAGRLLTLANSLKTEHGLQGKPLLPERFHVTLHHLGDFSGIPQKVVDAASRAASSLVSTAPFEVSFDRVVTFRARDQKPLVLVGDEGVAPLLDFHRRLETVLARFGIKPETRFKPHLTLLYDRQGIPETTVERLGWTVNEIVLVHSLLGQTKHVPLARWSLGLPIAPVTSPETTFSETDLGWMQRALSLAGQAGMALDEVPVGAVVVGPDGEKLAEASNLNGDRSDPCAHAEMLAITAAAQRLDNSRLTGCTLYVTLEPCAMCAMAMVHARIERLVYAARAPKTGAAGSVFDLLADRSHNHLVTVQGGLLAEEAGNQLSSYFKEKRSQKVDRNGGNSQD